MSDTQFQIERLREEAELLGDCETSRLVDDAADEIERLGRENAELDAMLTGIFARRVQESSAARMTEQRAREILAHMIQSNGNLYDEECLPVWRPGEPGALLMGRYTADELEAIAFWTRQHGN